MTGAVTAGSAGGAFFLLNIDKCGSFLPNWGPFKLALVSAALDTEMSKAANTNIFNFQFQCT